MILKPYTVCWLCLTLLLWACGQDEKVPNTPESFSQLTNGDFKDWRLSKVSYSLVNVTSQIPSCQRDEIYRFYADGRGEIRSGERPCNSPEPEVQTAGSWVLNDAGTGMKISWKQGQNWDVSLDALSATELVVTGKILEDYEVTATFKAL